jgi:hypothetical protein
MVDHCDRANPFQAHFRWHCDTWRAIGIDTYDEHVGIIGCKSEKPEVSDVQNVEIPGNESDPLASAIPLTDAVKLQVNRGKT